MADPQQAFVAGIVGAPAPIPVARSASSSAIGTSVLAFPGNGAGVRGILNAIGSYIDCLSARPVILVAEAPDSGGPALRCPWCGVEELIENFEIQAYESGYSRFTNGHVSANDDGAHVLALSTDGWDDMSEGGDGPEYPTCRACFGALDLSPLGITGEDWDWN